MKRNFAIIKLIGYNFLIRGYEKLTAKKKENVKEVKDGRRHENDAVAQVSRHPVR